MYEGSMVGKGAIVFALMGYVISKMECSWRGEGRAKVVTQGIVTLNPRLLHAVFGDSEEAIRAAISVLTSPDMESRSKEEEGRRLNQVGQYDYRVVNAPYYQNIKSKDDAREKAAARQRKHRSNTVVLSGAEAEAFRASKRRKIKAANSGASDAYANTYKSCEVMGLPPEECDRQAKIACGDNKRIERGQKQQEDMAA